MAKTATQALDVLPLDRLEQKVKALIALVDRLKSDAGRLAEDNARLSRELEGLHARLTDAETTTSEAATLREERDQIRSRVADMLQQLEGLAL